MNRNKQFAEHNKTGLIIAVIKLLVKDVYIGVQQNSEGGKIANIKDALTLRDAPQIKKRENVGIFPKWGTPPLSPLFGNETFV